MRIDSSSSLAAVTSDDFLQSEDRSGIMRCATPVELAVDSDPESIETAPISVPDPEPRIAIVPPPIAKNPKNGIQNNGYSFGAGRFRDGGDLEERETPVFSGACQFDEGFEIFTKANILIGHRLNVEEALALARVLSGAHLVVRSVDSTVMARITPNPLASIFARGFHE